MVASFGGGKNSNPQDFAPWLSWGKTEADEEVPFEQTLEALAMREIMAAHTSRKGD